MVSLFVGKLWLNLTRRFYQAHTKTALLSHKWLSALHPREYTPSLLLTEATSSCTVQIKPGRKSETGGAQKIWSILKMKHPVQTTDRVSLLKTDKRNFNYRYVAYSPLVKAQKSRKNRSKSTKSGRQGAPLLMVGHEAEQNHGTHVTSWRHALCHLGQPPRGAAATDVTSLSCFMSVP